jgi:hypothetical protein
MVKKAAKVKWSQALVWMELEKYRGKLRVLKDGGEIRTRKDYAFADGDRKTCCPLEVLQKNGERREIETDVAVKVFGLSREFCKAFIDAADNFESELLGPVYARARSYRRRLLRVLGLKERK